MKSSNYSFPHPVLGRDDDIEGSFLTGLEYTIGREEIALTCKFTIKNTTLEELIASEKAACCIQVTCSSTKYRKVFTLENNSDEFFLTAKKLRGKVEIKYYIISLVKITDYSPDEINKDYKGFGFDIEEGDILAHDFEQYLFPADKTWEKLMSISSFMRISESSKISGPAEYRLDEDKITIYLSQDDYAYYKFLHSNEKLASTFHASVAFPALMFAIGETIGENSPYSEKLWYLHLQSRKENDDRIKNNWEKQNIPLICQTILDNPLSRELTDLNKFIKDSVNENE